MFLPNFDVLEPWLIHRCIATYMESICFDISKFRVGNSLPKLVIFVATAFANFFFYLPWQYKQSQLGALKGMMGWWLVYNHVLDSRLRSLYSRLGSMVLLRWVFNNPMLDVFFIFRMDKCAECLLLFIQTSWICHQETLLCKCCCRYKLHTRVLLKIW